MRLKKISKKTRKIIAATTVVIFSLFTTITGAYAWFATNIMASVSSEEFSVVRIAEGASIESVRLIKFKYPMNSSTHKPDYLKANEGEVKVYTLQNNQFVDEDGYTTTIMNTYDPAERIIFGDSFSLFNTNCQVFYEITFSTSNFGSFDLGIEGTVETVEKNAKDIFLSDCADFTFFTPSDINNVIGIDPDTEKPYFYPSYIEYNSADPSNDMTELENIYYRLSYQASVTPQNQLSHFYHTNDNGKDSNINIVSGIPCTFSQQSSSLTVYVGVNYSPTKLENKYKDIYSGDCLAVFDYSIEFFLEESQGA